MDDQESNRPSVDSAAARHLATSLYGIEVLCIHELKSHSDRNFHIVAQKGKLSLDAQDDATKEDIKADPPGDAAAATAKEIQGTSNEFVLKVTPCDNHDSLAKIFEVQSSVLEHLKKDGYICPQIQQTLKGERTTVTEIQRPGSCMCHPHESSSQRCNIVMYNYIQGQPLYDFQPFEPRILYDMGRLLAELRTTFKDLEATENLEDLKQRTGAWSLENFEEITEYLDAVQDEVKVDIVEDIVCAFKSQVKPIWSALPKGLIHGDFHDENLLLLHPRDCQAAEPIDYDTPATEGAEPFLCSPNPRVNYGIIDFMDASYSPVVCDVALALAYAMIGVGSNNSGEPLDFILAGGHLLAGYVSVQELSDVERQALYVLVCCAYCMELVMCQHEFMKQARSNYYLLTSLKYGWKQLSSLWGYAEGATLRSWAEVVEKYGFSLA